MGLRVALVLTLVAFATIQCARGIHVAHGDVDAESANDHAKDVGHRKHKKSVDLEEETNDDAVEEKSDEMAEDEVEEEEEEEGVAELKTGLKQALQKMKVGAIEEEDDALAELEKEIEEEAALLKTNPHGGEEAAVVRIRRDGKQSVAEQKKKIMEQQKQTMVIVKRQVAAKKIFDKAQTAAQAKRNQAKSAKTGAEKAFCDAEAELKKAIALHKRAKVKQHVAIKKVAETIASAKDVMTAFDKAQAKANSAKSMSQTLAKAAFEEYLEETKKAEADGTDGDDDGDGDADKGREDLYAKAKAAEEAVETVNTTQADLIKKIQEVFNKAECPEDDAGPQA